MRLLLCLLAVSCFGQDWHETISKTIPFYGHRNWIAVADSAYPAQSAPGIETVLANADQTEVVNFILGELAKSKHVKPIVFTDEELQFVNEDDAPGISMYREALAGLLQDQTVNVLPHEQLIAKLEQVSRTFDVLIVKTNLTLPYTSVFFELDCAYWSPDAERRLRAAMPKPGK